jgi:hypothetical protein
MLKKLKAKAAKNALAKVVEIRDEDLRLVAGGKPEAKPEAA